MFLENKYSKWYFNIINNAKSRTPDGYTEKHHIIPKSLNGNNDNSNIIKLTAKEHFVCHVLLTKMVEGRNKSKMYFALKMMTIKTNKHRRDYKVTSKLYEYLKILHSALIKEMWEDPILKSKMSLRFRKQWTDDNYKNNIRQQMIDYWKDPLKREAMSKRMKEYWLIDGNKEENRRKQIEINKDPSIRASKASHGSDNGMFGKTHSEEVRTKLGKLAKERFSNKSYEELYGKEKSDKIKKNKSDKRKEYIKCNPQNGEKNPNSKSYRIVSPEHLEYIIHGKLVNFCKEHKLNISAIIDVVKGRKDHYKEWKISYL